MNLTARGAAFGPCLVVLAGLASAGTGACKDDAVPSADVADTAAAPDTVAPPDTPAPPAEPERAALRAACRFQRGARAVDTLGAEVPTGAAIPIDHFILLMHENRSFDHYFGTMPGVDGIPAGFTNPDKDGHPVAPHHLATWCYQDTAHGWRAVHRQYDDGKMDGFVTTNDPAGERALGYYTEAELPYYRALYATFAMSDRHFAALLGPTWPNRWFFMSATSFGETDGGLGTDLPVGPAPYIIQQALDDAGVDWAVYAASASWLWGGYPSYAGEHSDQIGNLDDFKRALATGTLRAVVWVEPDYYDLTHTAQGSDEHPPCSGQTGQRFVADVVASVMASPLWPRTALILTYDEHGGFFDHVPPPAACVPDDAPLIGLAPGESGAFDRFGIRVPLVVVSPYAKRGYVSHTPTDHTSILRLIEARFGLGALTRRDANAWPLLDLFDFMNPDASVPSLPPAPLPPSGWADGCPWFGVSSPEHD